MRHRLHGRSPEELRRMFHDWYLVPLAGALLEAEAGRQAVTVTLQGHPFSDDLGPGLAVGHRVLPGEGLAEPGAQWWLALDACRRLLFGDTGHELDDRESFALAFEPFCAPPGGAVAGPATVYAVARRRRPPYAPRQGNRPFMVEVEIVASRRVDDDASLAYRRRRAAAVAAPEAPPGDAVADYLRALADRDRLASYRVAFERIAEAVIGLVSQPEGAGEQRARETLAELASLDPGL